MRTWAVPVVFTCWSLGSFWLTAGTTLYALFLVRGARETNPFLGPWFNVSPFYAIAWDILWTTIIMGSVFLSWKLPRMRMFEQLNLGAWGILLPITISLIWFLGSLGFVPDSLHNLKVVGF